MSAEPSLPWGDKPPPITLLTTLREIAAFAREKPPPGAILFVRDLAAGESHTVAMSPHASLGAMVGAAATAVQAGLIIMPWALDPKAVLLCAVATELDPGTGACSAMVLGCDPDYTLAYLDLGTSRGLVPVVPDGPGRHLLPVVPQMRMMWDAFITT